MKKGVANEIHELKRENEYLKKAFSLSKTLQDEIYEAISKEYFYGKVALLQLKIISNATAINGNKKPFERIIEIKVQ